MKIFTHYRSPSMGWFRVLGYGLKWKDLTLHPFLFSERMGFVPGIIVKGYFIAFLKKEKP